MNVDEIKNLPSEFTTEETCGFKFYPSRISEEQGSGYKIRRFPACDLTLFFLNSHFRKEHNLVTVGDVVKLLDSWGYSESVYSAIRYIGFRFSRANWKWTSTQNLEKPLISVREDFNVAASNTPHLFVDSVRVKTYGYYSMMTDSALVDVFYFNKSENTITTDTPTWMIELNGYKFVPPEYTSMRDGVFSNLTFGVEIEVSSKLSRADLQYLVTEVEPKQEPFFYFKHDGSITGKLGYENYEIVTMPCSRKFLRKNLKMMFDKLEDRLPDWKNYFNVDESCGVHVHVGLNSFFSHLHTKKFVAIWNQFDRVNTDFIQKIGKRKFTTYCKVHEDHDGRTLARRLKHGAYAPGSDKKRYASCRETDYTAEVRIFKGGFSFEHIMYCIEAVEAMHSFAHKSPLSFISTRNFVPEFKSWLYDEQKYNRLKEYLKECA